MEIKIADSVQLNCGKRAVVEAQEGTAFHLRMKNGDLLKFTKDGKCYAGAHPEIDDVSKYDFYDDSMDVQRIL
jgi:hypothetical protein